MRFPKVIVYPTTEPVTLAEARLHLRLDTYDSPATHPDDSLVTALITVAREWAEKFTGRTISRKTLELALDEFPVNCAWLLSPDPTPIELRGGPLQSVVSLVYITADGQQTITDYQLDTHSEPPRLMPAAGTSWPTAKTQLNAVRVRYEAGYDLAGDSPNLHPLPLPIKQAILLVIGHLYENRESTSVANMSTVPMGAEFLLRPYRLDTSIG
jgi:uncharacterized phiE125 gp8 family phage protein